MESPVRYLLFLTAAGVGCTGGREQPCLTADPSPGPQDCFAAKVFSARDALSLFPDQEEVDRYWERWKRAVEAEPILGRRFPQRYRNLGTELGIITTNERAIMAWRSQMLVTGDESLDGIVKELGASEPLPSNIELGDGSVLFSLRVAKWPFNEEYLENRLTSTDSHLPMAEMRLQDDGIWTWVGNETRDTGTDEDTARIEFTFGWFDCFAGCGYFHTVRATVPPSGPATVCDLGGDSLNTAGFELSPATTQCESEARSVQ